MKKPTLIYVAQYGLQEEATLRGFGFSTIRVDNYQSLADALPASSEPQAALMRGSRLDQQAYDDIYRALSHAQVHLLNNPQEFSLHGSFRDYYPLIKDFSPRAIVLDRQTSVSEILSALKSAQLIPPLFVRSEIESAAKYVGVQGCLIQSINSTDVEQCKVNLDTHVTSYHDVIVKETIEIARHINGENLEYRAIVLGGKIVSFDFDTSKLPDPFTTRVASESSVITAAIHDAGFTGAFFMDFALTADNKVIIVETKDLLNGTIKNVADFGKGLATLCEA
jgi:hypothetical protein